MTIRRTLVAAALALAAAAGIGFTAVGQSSSPALYDAPKMSAHAQDPRELAHFIRATVHYDYSPVATPGLLRQQSDVAVLGTVASVEDTLLRTDAEDVGGVLVSLHVEEVWKDDPARQSEIVTYVIPRPTNIDISLYREALPVGTRVALFGNHTVETLLTQQPITDVVYDPAPQGLIFETGPGRAVNVWGNEAHASGWKHVSSIDELRAETIEE